MTKRFTLKSSVVVSSPENEDAIITFAKGLDEHFRPSNTGKSCVLRCIYYCFGGQENRLMLRFGYTTIKLFIETTDGDLVITRESLVIKPG